VAKKISSRRFLVVALLIIGIVCIVAAGLGLRDYLSTTKQGKTIPDTEILSRTIAAPAEKDPGPVTDDYQVPAEQPRVIDIPNLGVSAYVERVGMDPQNVMVAPDSIFFAGWYVGSVIPGEKGVSIIDGHVSGKYEDGIFRRLSSLKAGDTIRIGMGDKSWREFTVISSNSYSVEEAAKAMLADDPDIEKELHLITCDGVFNDDTQTYNQRLIVKAGLKPSV
jgi:LPXTG-site transpeptidase (sortase) family protein